MKLNTWQKEQYDLALLDESFIINLLEQKEREIYARIASLDFNEQPIDYIEGKVSDGSINIDGSSAIRRTCNLTMQVTDMDIQDVYWGIKTKFKLEIGIKNNLTNEYQASKNKLYPEIMWFPEGTYIITSFNTSISTKGHNISLTGKDKMVMLNGEIGGQIFASVDFGQESIQTRSFKPISTDIETSEVLISKTLFYKYGATIQNIPKTTAIWNGNNDQFVIDSNEIYKFAEDINGEWVKLENRYYRLKDLGYNKQSESYVKMENFPLTGINFSPVNGVEFHYYNDQDEEKVLSRTNFPAEVNEDHTKIIIYEQDENEELIEVEYQVKYKVTFKSKLFECYKKVEIPSEMFVQEIFNDSLSYEPNKYFYQTIDYSSQDNSTLTSFFRLNTTNQPKPQRNNYKIKTLFTMDSVTQLKKLPLERIIREMVHAYALEPYHNILINDLDEYGLEQLTYKGDSPLYVLRDILSGDFVQIAIKGKMEELDEQINSQFIFDSLSSGLTGASGSIVTLQNKDYTVAKIEKGQDIGYRVTDLVYAGELVTNIGDSLVTILDKIKDMLGEFEYFYDVEGHFVFQKKQTYVNTVWSQLSITDDDDLMVTYANEESHKLAYSFEGNKLLTAFNNNPNLVNLKNDYSVWGKKKTTSGAEYPIHARYAIDKKPKEYLAFNGVLYYTEEAIQDPSPEQANRIGANSQTSIDPANYHRLEIIPAVLKNEDGTSDWWELRDWAEYYHALVGVYPQQYLKDYGTEGFLGRLEFNNSIQQYFSGTGQLIIDFDKDSILPGELAPRLPLYNWRRTYKNKLGQDITETGVWYPFQHKYNGCWHWYSQYLDFYNSYQNMITYIYKPQIPTNDIIAKDGGSLQKWVEDQMLVDWRELIYRMAIDYFAGQGCSESEPIYDRAGRFVLNNPNHFLQAIAERNPYYFSSGYTGYEQYYTDMQGFWRTLYNPDYVPKPIYKAGYYTTQKQRLENSRYYQKQKIWTDSIIEDYEIQYYINPNNPKIIAQYEEVMNNGSIDLLDKYERYIAYGSDNQEKKVYWNINVFEHPESLDFWLEFLDDSNELAECSIANVGDRTKVVNDDKISAIYHREVPGIILTPNKIDRGNDGQWCDTSSLSLQVMRESGYTFIYLPRGFASLFDISYRSLSAKDKLDDLLYQFAYCIENVTITALPIYHLQPNVRVYVRDENTRVNGEYIVNKITIPLNITGTMSISAVKAPERFY